MIFLDQWFPKDVVVDISTILGKASPEEIPPPEMRTPIVLTEDNKPEFVVYIGDPLLCDVIDAKGEGYRVKLWFQGAKYYSAVTPNMLGAIIDRCLQEDEHTVLRSRLQSVKTRCERLIGIWEECGKPDKPLIGLGHAGSA